VAQRRRLVGLRGQVEERVHDDERSGTAGQGDIGEVSLEQRDAARHARGFGPGERDAQHLGLRSTRSRHSLPGKRDQQAPVPQPSSSRGPRCVGRTPRSAAGRQVAGVVVVEEASGAVHSFDHGRQCSTRQAAEQKRPLKIKQASRLSPPPPHAMIPPCQPIRNPHHPQRPEKQDHLRALGRRGAVIEVLAPAAASDADLAPIIEKLKGQLMRHRERRDTADDKVLARRAAS